MVFQIFLKNKLAKVYSQIQKLFELITSYRSKRTIKFSLSS